MDARIHRGWDLLLNSVILAASGLLERLGPVWTSLSWIIDSIPLLPANSLELINKGVGERVVTRRCSRRPSRVLVIVSRWRILSLGVFLCQARRESAPWARLSREDRRRRIRQGEYGSSESEGPPELGSATDEEDEATRLLLRRLRQSLLPISSAGRQGKGRGKRTPGIL